MAENLAIVDPKTISIKSAQQLVTTINTRPQIPSKSPRWLLKALPWVNVESGIYRINRVKCHLEGMSTTIPPEYDKKGNPTITEKSLKKFYLFQHLNEEDLAAIAKEMVRKETKPNEVIVKEGEHGNKFFVIINGNFDVSFQSQHGQELVMASLRTGDFFGEISLLKNVPRQATVTSKTPGLLYSLSKSAFDKVIKHAHIKTVIEQAALQRQHEIEVLTSFGEKKIPIKAGHTGESPLPNTFIEYDENPLEIHLSVIQTIIGIHTRIADVYNTPYSQVEEQIRVTTEMILEREEWELINNKSFGLLYNALAKETIATRSGPPTPHDLDELLSIVWKKPSLFLAHPRAIAAFGRECTKNGVPPPTVNMLGGTFITWRGVPLIPTEKLEIDNTPNSPTFGTTNIICIRLGEQDQGVVGLYKNDIPGQTVPGLAVHFMGIDDHSIASYLLTKYFSLAVLVPDAIGILKGVEVGNYYE